MTATLRQPKSPRTLSGLNPQHLFTIPMSQYPKHSLHFACSHLCQVDGLFRCFQGVSDNLEFYVKTRIKVSALEINMIKIYTKFYKLHLTTPERCFRFEPRCTHLSLISFNCILKENISGDLKCREESTISV